MLSNDFLRKYYTVDDTIEFPGSRKITNPLAMNEFWTYVGSPYLNGFINEVKILKAFWIDRYYDPSEGPIEISYQRENKWDKRNFTEKDLAIDFMSNKVNGFFHTKIGELSDDCVLIATVEDDPNQYVVFWFDLDVSDCSIGRFKTDIVREEVLSDFSQWAAGLSEDNQENGLTGQRTREIPLRWFSGWISF